MPQRSKLRVVAAVVEIQQWLAAAVEIRHYSLKQQVAVVAEQFNYLALILMIILVLMTMMMILCVIVSSGTMEPSTLAIYVKRVINAVVHSPERL